MIGLVILLLFGAVLELWILVEGLVYDKKLSLRIIGPVYFGAMMLYLLMIFVTEVAIL